MPRRLLAGVFVIASVVSLLGRAQPDHRATSNTHAVQFTEHLIADKYGYAFGVAAADLDGDGDLDLTSCDTTNNALYWFENDGRGTFKRHFIQQNETGWFERHAIGDVNGDKRPDVVVVKNQDGHLVWFENSGQPAKDKIWKRHVITTNLKRAYDVALADLNGDGHLDVAASAWNGNHLAWFQHPGALAPLPKGERLSVREWQKHMIDDRIAETRTIRVADFNGDGKPDVLGTARLANLTAWYEKTDSKKEPWRRHVIDDQSPQPVHGQPVDMDGDGDVDVVMALGMLARDGQADTNQVVLYENVGQPGTGAKWKKHFVGSLPFAFEAVAGDLDGDGDLDIVATAWGGAGQLVWFENTGDPRTGWKTHLLKDRWSRANQVILADLDGDRRLDIVATAERGANELRWWQNTSIAYPDHTDLSHYRDREGRQHPIKSVPDWQIRRRHVVENLQRVMGPLPGPQRRVPLDIKVIDEQRVGSLVRRKITYQSDPDDRVPAYLFLPVDPPAKKSPAMLCLHQTAAAGKDEPAGVRGDPELKYALELAQRGYIAIVPDYPSFGEHKFDFKTKTAYASGSMKAIWDNVRAVDVLETLAHVDTDRIGVIGHSLGGHNGMFTAVFEPRLKVIVSSCGFTTFRKDDLPSWTGPRYMPRIQTQFHSDVKKVPFDFQEIVAAFAPRPFLACAAEKDTDFDVSGVRDVMDAARAVYKLFGVVEHLAAHYPPGKHAFPAAARKHAYEFLDRHLRSGK